MERTRLVAALAAGAAAFAGHRLAAGVGAPADAAGALAGGAAAWSVLRAAARGAR